MGMVRERDGNVGPRVRLVPVADIRNPAKLDLSFIDANTKHAGVDVFSFINFQNFHHNAAELRESFGGGNTIVSGDVNGDGKADFSILLLGHLVLQGTDFI